VQTAERYIGIKQKFQDAVNDRLGISVAKRHSLKSFTCGRFGMLAITSVAVEKLDLCGNGMILGDSKWSVDPYESLTGHPDAMIFPRVLGG
jgi:hypothetical protein